MLSLLIALGALQTAPPAPPPPADPGMASLLSVDDYPAEAVAKGWEGTVQVQMEISKEGRVSGCRVLQSSGHDVLDTRTCAILKERARFIPARNSRGEAVPDVYVKKITWGLSDEPAAGVPTEPAE